MVIKGKENRIHKTASAGGDSSKDLQLLSTCEALHLVRVVHSVIDFTPNLLHQSPDLDLACDRRAGCGTHDIVDAGIERRAFLRFDAAAPQEGSRLIIPGPSKGTFNQPKALLLEDTAQYLIYIANLPGMEMKNSYSGQIVD